MYGAKCGFCYGTGDTGKKSKRNRSEAQERFISAFTCTCGAKEDGLSTHAVDCRLSYDGRSLYGAKRQYTDKSPMGNGNYHVKKKTTE